MVGEKGVSGKTLAQAPQEDLVSLRFLFDCLVEIMTIVEIKTVVVVMCCLIERMQHYKSVASFVVRFDPRGRSVGDALIV